MIRLNKLLKESVNFAEDFKTLEKMLKSQDWTYEYSDDHRRYKAGSESLSKIRDLIKKLNNLGFATETSAMWKKYSKFPR